MTGRNISLQWRLFHRDGKFADVETVAIKRPKVSFSVSDQAKVKNLIALLDGDADKAFTLHSYQRDELVDLLNIAIERIDNSQIFAAILSHPPQ